MKNFIKNTQASTVMLGQELDQKELSKQFKTLSVRQKAVMLMTFATLFHQSMYAQSDAASEINDLWKDQINPILNAVLGIAVAIAAVVVGIQFFQGKKEALKQLGYVIAGAVVVKVLTNIIAGILSGSNNEIDMR